jgi:hypothetical protein
VWTEAFRSLLVGTNPQHTAYYITEFLGLAIGIIACVVVISWGSGPAQDIQRYILGAPGVLVVLARLSNHPAFDRAWTILSILLMGLLAMLFAFNMWVG